ncbi:hypothetical protein AB0L06_29570 [Spirillospora sp. NPDC052269]
MSDPARPNVGMLVTCLPRTIDADRLWFWAPGKKPLAEASNIADTVIAIRARLLELADEDGRS